MAGLQPEEGDARARLDRRAARFAAVAVEPRGNVDREHWRAAARETVDPLDDRLRLAIEVAGKTRAEKRVDDAIGAVKLER